MDSGKPLMVDPSAPGRDPVGNNSSQLAGPHPPTGSVDPENKAGAPAVEEVPLVLLAKPRLQLGQGTLSTSSKPESSPATKMKLKK